MKIAVFSIMFNSMLNIGIRKINFWYGFAKFFALLSEKIYLANSFVGQKSYGHKLTRERKRVLTRPKVVDFLLGLLLLQLGLLRHELLLPFLLQPPLFKIINVGNESSRSRTQTFCWLRFLSLLPASARTDPILVVAAAFLLRNNVGRLVGTRVVVLQADSKSYFYAKLSFTCPQGKD